MKLTRKVSLIAWERERSEWPIRKLKFLIASVDAPSFQLRLGEDEARQFVQALKFHNIEQLEFTMTIETSIASDN